MSPLYVKSNPNPEKICTELDCIPVEGSLLWRNANFLDLWELYCCLETQSEESNLFCCAPKPSYDHSSNNN